MKLIKINTDHYIIVDDSEIKEGDWVYQPMTNAVYKTSRTDNSDIGYKITHSTQPLEAPVAINGYGSYEYISLQEVKELIDEVDVEKKAKYYYGQNRFTREYEDGFMLGFKLAYNQCLEDNKDKKFTEFDIIKTFEYGWNQCFYGIKDEEKLRKIQSNFIQSLQPKTEWEVEFDEQGKLKLV